MIRLSIHFLNIRGNTKQQYAVGVFNNGMKHKTVSVNHLCNNMYMEPMYKGFLQYPDNCIQTLYMFTRLLFP